MRILMFGALVLTLLSLGACGAAAPNYGPEEQARFDQLGADLQAARQATSAAKSSLAKQYGKTGSAESSAGAKTADAVVCGTTVGTSGFGKFPLREKPNRRVTFTPKGKKSFGARTCNAYELKVVK